MTNNNITEEMIEAGLADLRDRRLLKWLFNPEPDHAGAIGYVEAPLELDTQREVVAAIYTAMQAASQPPVTMDGLVERVAMACCNDLPARVIAEREDADSYDEGEDEVQDYWCCIARAAIEAAGIPTLLATIERQREALEPFAEAYRQAEPWREFEGRDCRELCVINAVSLSDFEAASKALESQP